MNPGDKIKHVYCIRRFFMQGRTLTTWTYIGPFVSRGSVVDPFHFDTDPKRILLRIRPKIEKNNNFFYTFFLLITQKIIYYYMNIESIKGSHKKKSFFSGPATKAPTIEVSGHIFLELQKKFFFLNGRVTKVFLRLP